jgi:hypothetical protein
LQTDLNPSVARDKQSMKFRVLLFADGIPTALGTFNADDEALLGYQV